LLNPAFGVWSLKLGYSDTLLGQEGPYVSKVLKTTQGSQYLLR
jgi:hypothetical protein